MLLSEQSCILEDIVSEAIHNFRSKPRPSLSPKHSCSYIMAASRGLGKPMITMVGGAIIVLGFFLCYIIQSRFYYIRPTIHHSASLNYLQFMAVAVE